VQRGAEMDASAMLQELGKWADRSSAGERKLRLFGRSHLDLARAQLLEHRDLLYPSRPGAAHA
jgi:hypothetical protein